jgi:hypothetical protein
MVTVVNPSLTRIYPSRQFTPKLCAKPLFSAEIFGGRLLLKWLPGHESYPLETARPT